MTKKLKKCYHFMNLRYDASPQQVEARKQMMLENLQQKSKNQKAIKTKIKKITLSAEAILANIKINGIPTQKIAFDTSLENLGSLFTALLVVFVFAVVIFCIMI